MKKILVLVLAMILIFTVSACGDSAPATSVTSNPPASSADAPAKTPDPDEVITLSLQIQWPASMGTNTYCYTPWIEAVEEASGGKVDIELYEKSGLVPLDQTLDGLRNGVVDICEINPDRMPGQLTLWEIGSVIDLDRASADDANYSEILWALYNEKQDIMSTNIEDMKVLFCWTTGPCNLFTSEVRPESFADLKNLKNWCAGSVVEFANECIGLVPTTVADSDTYTSFQRGVVDTVVMACPLAYDNGIYEVANYCLKLNMNFACWPVMMTLDTWNSLPADIQAAFESVSGEYAARLFDEGLREAKAYADSQYPDLEYYTFSDEEIAKGVEMCEPIFDFWVEEAAEYGYSAEQCEELYDAFIELEYQFGAKE